MFAPVIAVSALLASIVAPVAAQNLNASTLITYVNPNLTSTCLGNLSYAANQLHTSCGVDLGVLLNASVTENTTSLENSTNWWTWFAPYTASNQLDTFCSDTCQQFWNDQAASLPAACGKDALLQPQYTGNQSIDADTLINSSRYSRRFVCAPNGNSLSNSTITHYCVQDQAAAINQTGVNVMNTTAVLEDSSVICRSCIYDEIAQLNRTDYIPAYLASLGQQFASTLKSYADNCTSTFAKRSSLSSRSKWLL